MKLSIIIPAYNAESYIENCINDVISQSFSDFEVIIVNDGSTDKTQSIIDEYTGMYPELLKSLTVSNGGQGRARNFALREVKGDYVGFVDSDDRISPDMFSKMYEAAVSNDADVVVCDYYRVVNNDEKHYEKAAMQDHPLSSVGPVWNKIFRRSAIGGVRFAEGFWYEDYTFSCKMLLKSKKTVFVHEPLYYYYVGHTSTMTNQNALKNLDIITVIDGVKQWADREGIAIDSDFLIINHVLLEAIKRVNNQNSKDKKEVIKKLRDYVHQNIPDLSKSQAYQNETRNRRIIMKLNYDGHENLAKGLLKLK